MDFDMIPKTERLDNQAAVTRPKMTHNPPSRTHLVSVEWLFLMWWFKKKNMLNYYVSRSFKRQLLELTEMHTQ